MSRHSHSPSFRAALIGAFAVLLALAGCGRKGALDPPPSAASATGKQPQTDTSLIRSPFGGPAEASTAAPKSSNKNFILDPLLN
ncbi:MAG TPA: lipoprotein [Pseudolabrys sp.]|nr:lipoprotein [Pseudolabrys sp.]